MTDERYNELMCPQPSVVIRSLAQDPNYVKCPRCWNYTHEGLSNYDNLCDECCSTLVSAWPDHPSVPHIKAAQEAWRNHHENNHTVVQAKPVKTLYLPYLGGHPYVTVEMKDGN